LVVICIVGGITGYTYLNKTKSSVTQVK